MSRKKGIDWDSVAALVDVDVSNAEIAAALGVTAATVSIARRRRGIIAKDKRKHIDWPNVPGFFNPDVSHSALARSLGCTKQAVMHARRNFASAKHRRGAPPVVFAAPAIRALYAPAKSKGGIGAGTPAEAAETAPMTTGDDR